VSTVLQILNYAAPYKGNFIHSIENLEKKAKAKGINFIYLFPESAKKLPWIQTMQSQGMQLCFIPSTFFGNTIKLRNIRFVIHLINNSNINIIHTHFIDYNYSLFIARFLIKSNVLFIGHIHNQYHLTKNFKGGIKRHVTNSIFDKIIGVGEAVIKRLIYEGISENKLLQITNAIDFERLDKYESINIRKYPEQNVILMFGWLFYIKGVDIALSAIQNLRDLGHNVILAISLVGAKDNIVREIMKLFDKIPDWLVFLDSRNDVASYYNASDIFLSASREEGLNYSVVEAAYCKPMVLISDAPGNPQDIPGVFLHETGNVQQLSKLIIDALSTSDEERKIRKRIQREYVIQNYNINVWSNEILDLYNRLRY
jgi:glycosyltransferase involved in cell wall biosynthesis